MKKSFIALSSLTMFAVGCHNDDDSHWHGPQIPAINLVAPDGFKNTAKNATEVASHLTTAGKSIGEVKFGSSEQGTSNPPPSSNTNPITLLASDEVSRFLSAEDRNVGNGENSGTIYPDLSVGADCGSSLNMLNEVYRGSSSVIKGIADELVKIDSSQLPEGVTKGASNDQFAVTLNVDLSKVKNQAQSSDSIPNNETIEPPVSSPGHSTPVATAGNFSGTAVIGAGASEDLAVLALGANGAGSNEQSDLNFDASFSVGVYSKEQKFKLNFGGNSNYTVKDNGHSQSFNMNGSASATLAAGHSPYVLLSLTANGNGIVDPSTRQFKLDDKQHSTVANFKVQKGDNNGVLLTYDVTTDGGRQQSGSVAFVTDEMGRCVVKNPSSNFLVGRP
jgi:hypothetical protein